MLFRSKLLELAGKLNCELEGDGAIEITGVAGIEEAREGELTFFVNRKYRPALATTRASAILVAHDAGPVPLAALRSSNPYLDFARAIEIFHAAPAYAPGIHPTAVVSTSAQIGAGAHIGPYCFVDDGARKVLLEGGKSLLPAGVIGAQGRFRPGDVVSVADRRGRVFARGIARWDSEQVDRGKGKRSAEVRILLGPETPAEVVHRDDLTILPQTGAAGTRKGAAPR